jgi:putative ABC transport system ATP-binding protein
LQLSAGEILFEQGSWGETIYVVESGEVEIVAQKSDGSEEAVAVVTPGHYFGEMGPLFRIPRSATARARADATVVGYNSHDFRKLTKSGGMATETRIDDLSRAVR